MASRVLVVWLDGFDVGAARRLMAEGALPALAALDREAAVWPLRHGPAKSTGLAGEHFTSGLDPAVSGRPAVVSFDPATYTVWQDGVLLPSFLGRLDARTVVLDTAYLDIASTPGVRGIVDWGGHDPGTRQQARPASLLKQVAPYPAREFLYGVPWPSAQRTQEAGRRLAEAAAERAEVAEWLLAEACPDWDLAIVGVTETHVAFESFMHGLDPGHVLASHPSAPAAAEAMMAVLRAVDGLVARLRAGFPDASLVVFSMHGMGPNDADVASFVLLPELLYRWSFGEPKLHLPEHWASEQDGVPLLGPGESWQGVVDAAIPRPTSVRTLVPAPVKRALDPVRRRRRKRFSLEWMPAARYQRHWPQMRAFAFPSFYDGQIRVNLRGRERDGVVDLADYDATVAELVQLVSDCRDTVTGEPIASSVEPVPGDPMQRRPNGADIRVWWRPPALGIDHPQLGRIGPMPPRRTGGHTVDEGVCWVAAPGVAAGGHDWRSSFDVAPTIVDLLGHAPLPDISGRSLLAP